MKSLKLLIIIFATAVSTVAKADCAGDRNSLYEDVNSAIHTYPASCVGYVHIKCGFLFNSGLPVLLKQLETDTPKARENLRKAVKAISDRRAELNALIDTPYVGQMNRIVSGLNSYVRRCVR